MWQYRPLWTRAAFVGTLVGVGRCVINNEAGVAGEPADGRDVRA